MSEPEDDPPVILNKEPWLAVVLSSVFPGAGHVYSGKTAVGVALFVLTNSLFIGGVWMVYAERGSTVGGVISLVVAAVLWSIGNISALRVARAQNTEEQEAARKKYKDPWRAVWLSWIVSCFGFIYLKRWIALLVWIIVVSIYAYKAITMEFRTLAGSMILAAVVVLINATSAVFAHALSPAPRTRGRSALAQRAFAVLAVWWLLWGAFMFFRTAIVEPYVIEGGSMRPALLAGDRFLVQKWNYKPLRRGELVVYTARKGYPWVKRVAAFEGEVVEIKGGQLWIDGKAIDDPHFKQMAEYQYATSDLHGVNGNPYRVPAESIFVVGDNGATSLDSRTDGAVPEGRIIGITYKRIWPLGDAGPIP